MKKRLGGLAIAVAAVIGFTSPAAAVPAGPIVVTPGYKGVITTNEPTTFEFTGCAGTIEFVLFYFVDGVEVTRFLGSVPGPNGSWTFSSPTPGTFKIITNCFVDDELDSVDFVFIEVVPPPVDTTAPPAPTTAAPVPTTAAPGPGPAPNDGASPAGCDHDQRGRRAGASDDSGSERVGRRSTPRHRPGQHCAARGGRGTAGHRHHPGAGPASSRLSRTDSPRCGTRLIGVDSPINRGRAS